MRLRALAIPALATVLAASVSTGVSYGVGSSANADPAFDLPSLTAVLPTPFESNGATNWTSAADEQSFLSSLDAASPRTTVSQIGATKQGRPIQLVKIEGTPKNSSMKDHATVFFLCSQHGNEPAGREACLITMRDLALGTDTKVTDMLQDVTVLFVPNANPDGRAANTRGNSDGVDINRDHLELATLEDQTYAREIFLGYKPDLVHDLHEYSGEPRTDITYMWPRNLNVDLGVYEQAVDLNREWVVPAIESGGYSTNLYATVFKNGRAVAQSAGDEDERILRNTSGLRHALGILVESYTANQSPAEQATPALNRLRRVTSHVLGVEGTLGMLEKNRTRRDITAATDHSRVNAVTRWSQNVDAFWFGGADNRMPSTTEVAVTPPCAYTLTAEQYAAVSQTLALHGVTVTPLAGGGARVSMAQESSPVIPLLLDRRALRSPVDATAVNAGTAACAAA